MGREMVIGDGVAELTKLQDSGVVLTSRSLQVRGVCELGVNGVWADGVAELTELQDSGVVLTSRSLQVHGE